MLKITWLISAVIHLIIQKEIDINRAEEAFKRAEERLTSKKENVDIERAKKSIS